MRLQITYLSAITAAKHVELQRHLIEPCNGLHVFILKGKYAWLARVSLVYVPKRIMSLVCQTKHNLGMC